MSALRSGSIILAMSLTTSLAFAEDFDGSQPLECTAKSGRDCLPTKSSCGPLNPESSRAPIYGIDVANKQVHSPYRTALMPILYNNTNQDSLVLQGADLGFAWSAIVNRKTGAITISVADKQGAMVLVSKTPRLRSTQTECGADCSCHGGRLFRVAFAMTARCRPRRRGSRARPHPTRRAAPLTTNVRMVNQNWWITLMIQAYKHCPPLTKEPGATPIVGGGFSGVSARRNSAQRLERRTD
jgi:hypothetical protein